MTLFRYLFNSTCPQDILESYSRAVDAKSLYFNDRENRVWEKMLKTPRLIGPFESYLAIVNPSSSIRKRIQLMSAIAESHRDYGHYFLPRQFSTWDVFRVIVVGIQSVFSFILGVLLWNVYAR